MSDAALEYAVRLPHRVQHLIEVTVTVPEDAAPGARVVLPTWTPGSYVVRNYVHHVQRITARDADGPVVLTPDGTSAWLLPDDVEGAVEIELELYANDLSVRTNHVDDHHALIIPAATFPYVEGTEERDHVVRFEIDEADGPVHAMLPSLDGDPVAFVASGLDRLVDSAFEVGDLPSVDFEVAGVPHRFVWAGHGGAPDLDRIARDATALGEEAVALFDGDLPTEDYTFLCIGWDRGGGGLEHRDGATLMMPVRTFQTPDLYAKFQTLVAHEYLHLWNVKRLTPAALVRPDYEHPTHTTSLWVAEGWTAYYDELLPLRAGVWTTTRYLDHLATVVAAVRAAPGAALQSVHQSSHDAWVKQYVRDENSSNAGVDYYGHGAVLAWCLDLSIRQADPAGPGLDAAVRELWTRFGRSGTGYTEDDVIEAVTGAAGRDLSAFFQRHVAGTDLPPIDDLVGTVGLRFVDTTAGDQPPAPRLGVAIDEDDDGVTLTAVLRGEAAWRAGLTGGDRLLAVDGQRVRRGELGPLLAAHAAGDTVRVTVFRGPRLLTLPVTLDEHRPKRELKPVEDPSADQLAAFRSWTGTSLDEVG